MRPLSHCGLMLCARRTVVTHAFRNERIAPPSWVENTGTSSDFGCCAATMKSAARVASPQNVTRLPHWVRTGRTLMVPHPAWASQNQADTTALRHDERTFMPFERAGSTGPRGGRVAPERGVASPSARKRPRRKPHKQRSSPRSTYGSPGFVTLTIPRPAADRSRRDSHDRAAASRRHDQVRPVVPQTRVAERRGGAIP